MKILLDTNVFLWAITDDVRLRKPQREAFMDEGNDLYLSVASVWEILIKTGLGKLPMPLPAANYVHKQMERNRIAPLGIQSHHLAALEELPPLHRDPFDRMLLAQAKSEGIPLMTGDRALRRYGVKLL